MKEHFSRFLQADPGRVHVAAHSHHPWPDVTFEAHQRAWLDAAELSDDKWERVFGEVLPAAQRAVAMRLGLPDPSTIVFAVNTHELLLRLLSCLPAPTRILATDAEFHSFTRQVRRLEEDGAVVVERVPAAPLATFADRLGEHAAAGGYHLLYVSHVHFDSGYVLPDLGALVAAVPDDEAFVVFDGYHAFMALPTNLPAVADRVFYLAGGYKYAMAGEGAVFMHCPPGYGPRPANTGWYAAFGALAEGVGERVAYASDARRFLGATFDPSGLYRFVAVQEWLDRLGVTVDGIHTHVARLQEAFVKALDARGGELGSDRLVVGPGQQRGHFLAFHVADAADRCARLRARKVIADARGDRLRIGFGIYHDAADIEELLRRLPTA